MPSRMLTVLVWAAAVLAGTAGALTGCSGNMGVLPERWDGTWYFRADLGAPGISSLTDAQARDLLGETIELGEKDAEFVRIPCAAPTYSITQSEIDALLLDYRVSRERLPLVGGAAEVLEVQCRNSVSYRLVRLTSGCVIASWEGRVFRLSKKLQRMPQDNTQDPQCLRDETRPR